MVKGRSLDLETTRRKGVDPRGRSCPLTYRYQPEALAQPAQLEVDTLHVVGGLYGNPYGTHVGPLRCDALPVRFDLAGWTARLLAQWPPGSPATGPTSAASLSAPTSGPSPRNCQTRIAAFRLPGCTG
jgi:hypothetical protein